MPDLDAGALIEKHRARGVLVNSNLLVLLLVSQVDPRQIWQFTRTQNFTGDDFRLLASLIAWFGKLITPHVLAQLSDLAGLRRPHLQTVRRYEPGFSRNHCARSRSAVACGSAVSRRGRVE